MQINYNVTGAKRKELVNAISQKLNAPARYLGAPTFAYEVADYNIDKNGVVRGPDNSELVNDLLGLHNFKAVTEEFDTPLPKAEPVLENIQVPNEAALGGRESPNSDYEEPPVYSESDETEETVNLIIHMPREGFSETALDNLKGLVESKAALIKTALDTDSIPINVTEEIVAFPWFQGECSAEEVKAYTHFITALCEMAKKQTRVNSTEKSVENEKYAFRCFLLRLGFIGPEYKTERKILLSKLSGSSAFKSVSAKHEEVSE
ncbi:virulence protein [Clostridium tyrobutyricum]|uniref:virulence protein n=1 Tax=Clostridium tyrobutyricum TaxID=1519 RepID=UPI001C37F00F|nr:virulence protein [Clostridium tyrobutyricum]MBV4431554.1 virulence protein [Clostridium tyrobutyricum]